MTLPQNKRIAQSKPVPFSGVWQNAVKKSICAKVLSMTGRNVPKDHEPQLVWSRLSTVGLSKLKVAGRPQLVLARVLKYFFIN
jgi:hypothetical protein